MAPGPLMASGPPAAPLVSLMNSQLQVSFYRMSHVGRSSVKGALPQFKSDLAGKRFPAATKRLVLASILTVRNEPTGSERIIILVPSDPAAADFPFRRVDLNLQVQFY